jgi:hypothetical protein
MISLAGPGGGVGPHVDSYDVFLIQMSGRRHWKISTQSDLSLKPNLPLKILAQFKPPRNGFWSRATCSTYHRMWHMKAYLLMQAVKRGRLDFGLPPTENYSKKVYGA